MSSPLKPPGPTTAAIMVAERDRAPHGLTYDSQAQRAISADLYHYQAELSERTRRPATGPHWLGTLAYYSELSDFSD